MNSFQQTIRNIIRIRTLKDKVTLIALLAMILIGGIIGFSGYLGNRSLTRQMEKGTIENERILFKSLLDRHFQMLRFQLSQLLKLQEILDAFAERDRDALEIASMPAFQLMGTQGNFIKLSFYLQPGTPFYRSGNPTRNSGNHTDTSPLVREVFRTKKIRMGVEEEEGHVYLSLAQPLYRQGTLLGVVEAGGDLQPVLEDLKNTIHADASIFLKKDSASKISSSTYGPLELVATTNEKWLDKTARAISIADGLKQERRIRYTDGNRTFATTLIPFQDFSGKTIGVTTITSDITAFQNILDKTLLRSFLIALLGFLLAALLIFSTLHRNFKPLNRMAELIRKLGEGGGDLTRRIPIRSKDEIGELADGMNRFIQYIHKLVAQIHATMGVVSASSQQIAENTNRVAVGAGEQDQAMTEIVNDIDAMNKMNQEVVGNAIRLAEDTEEASSSIMEMSASIDEVAENIRNSSLAVEENAASISEMVKSIDEISSNIESLSSSANQTSASIEEITRSIAEVSKNAVTSLNFSKEAVAKAEGGMVAVTKTKEGMVKIQKTFEESARTIQQLGEKSVEIGKILRVIDEVADQTNLLALNAAIIAAQAGEHGKGFAVVADEIKALAERSATSSKEIAQLIRNVQKESEEAIQSMEVSSSSITEGMELSLQAGEALKEIMQSVTKSWNMIEEISQTTVAQDKGSQMVRQAVSTITDSLNAMARGTREQKEASKHIMTNTEDLRNRTLQINRAMQEQAKGGGQINRVIEEINTKSQNISKSMGLQSQHSQEVLQHIKRIEQITSKNTLQVQEMTTAMDEMNRTVEALQNMIGEFKV